MNHLRSLTYAILLTGILSAVPSARGDVLLGNFPQTNDNVGHTINSTFQKAPIFTLGSTGYTIDSVVLRFGAYNTSEGDSVRLGIFLDNGSQTNFGAQVGSYLSSPASSDNNFANFTFLPSGSLTLNPNTTYWLRLEGLTGSFNWQGANPPVAPSGTGATYDLLKHSTDTGASWFTMSSIPTFQINATPVPEPGSALLLAVAGAGLLARRRR